MNDTAGRGARPGRGRRRLGLSGLKRRSPPGARPGTLAPSEDAAPPRIDIMSYDAEELEEIKDGPADHIAGLRGRRPVLWVNVSGLADTSLIARLGKLFGLHALSLEDVVNVHQRPKAEDFHNHMFLVARMLRGRTGAETEQVSIFLGKNYLLTFQEHPGDCFGPVRDRLRHGRGRIREAGPDYLCYALIDAIVDSYFPTLEHFGEALELLEDQVVAAPRAAHVHLLHEHKRELLLLRRALWPCREMVNSLVRDSHPLFDDATRVYLRDCYDHTIQLMDIVETYREIASGLLDIYISSVSAKLNEIMKVLTVIATIFIPLGFVAGVYGMNFDPKASPWNMPELGWYFGYPLALLIMAAIAGGLLWYFWRKGWLGGEG